MSAPEKTSIAQSREEPVVDQGPLSPSPAAPIQRKRKAIPCETVEDVRRLLQMPGISHRDIAQKYYRGQISRQTVDRIARALSKNEPKWLEPKNELQTRDVGREIGGNQPALKASFGNGLGADPKKSRMSKVLNDSINDLQAHTDFGHAINHGEDFYAIKRIVGLKGSSSREDRYREIHKQLFESLGSNVCSDDDFSFGLYDSTFELGLAAIELAEKEGWQVKREKIAVAAVAYARPQWTSRLETKGFRTLACPYCKKERMFYESKKEGIVICCFKKCRRAIPVEEAQRYIKYNVVTVDPQYLALVHRTVTRSRGEPGPAQVPDGRAESPQDTFQSRSRVGLEPERFHDNSQHRSLREKCP